jgi:hypothetical protein
VAKPTLDLTEIPGGLVTWVYGKKLFASLVCYLILHHFWGGYMLTSLGHLMGSGIVLAGLSQVWFIFAWALGVTALGLLRGDRHYSVLDRTTQVRRGLWLSLNAGFFEEIIYRGTMFLNFMVGLLFLNWLTVGLVMWVFVHLLVPLANFATFHVLQPQLMDPRSWVFGAAMVAATASFRDEHKYLGWFGWINSWFFGMVMFFLVFHYGLLTAIAAHALYDALIFTIRGLTSKQESALVTYLRRAIRTK